MKAVVLVDERGTLELRDEPEPSPGHGQSLVRLEAAALNRRDFWITQGLYPGIRFPCILGSDGAGMAGDREVVIDPGFDWGDNPRVQSPGFRILGMPDNGTFAEAVAVPTEALHDKPPHLDWVEAAALPLGGLTAYRALFTQGELAPGEQVLVTGIGGGVATFALQFAVAAGAEVVVTSSSDQKLGRARELGAGGSENYRQEGWAKRLRQTHGGFDLIIDGAGGAAYGDLVGLLRPAGRLVNYGATAGPPGPFDLFRVFWNQLKLLGSTMGSPDDFRNMLSLVRRHQIRPAIDLAASLDEVPQLVSQMAETPQFGKRVVRVSGSGG